MHVALQEKGGNRGWIALSTGYSSPELPKMCITSFGRIESALLWVQCGILSGVGAGS